MLIKLLISAIAIYIAAFLLPGVSVKGFWYSVGIAIVLAILNFLVKPFLVLLSIPINVLTFGLFNWVIDAIIILLAGRLLSGFSVRGFWSALLFSFVSACITQLIYWIV